MSIPTEEMSGKVLKLVDGADKAQECDVAQ